MPALGFSGANLATVAYAEVDGVAGASTLQNSGITTTRTALGVYVVMLPTTLAQPQSRDLIFVTPRVDTAGSDLEPKRYLVDDRLDATKVIHFSDSTTFVDSSFTILILRTTIAPPAQAPA